MAIRSMLTRLLRRWGVPIEEVPDPIDAVQERLAACLDRIDAIKMRIDALQEEPVRRRGE